MLVSELIEILKGFPHDRRVLVEGYEGGYDEPGTVHSVVVVATGYDDWWAGKFDDDRKGNTDGNFDAVIIPR